MRLRARSRADTGFSCWISLFLRFCERLDCRAALKRRILTPSLIDSRTIYSSQYTPSGRWIETRLLSLATEPPASNRGRYYA